MIPLSLQLMTLSFRWTNFCLSGQVPQKNLSDFLNYSPLALTTTTCTCPADPNPSCSQLFNVCITSAVRRSPDSFFMILMANQTILTNPYADRNCVLAATCCT